MTWPPSISPRKLGAIQFAVFVGLLYVASFGGILVGMIPPALIIGGKGVVNLFTRSK